MEIFVGEEFKKAADEEKNWSEMECQIVGELTRKIEYGADSHLFRTTVTMGENELTSFTRAGYEPRFGIDVADMNEIGDVSEKMSVKLENN